MKRFTFPLEHARRWRESQVAMEEALLESLFAERAMVELRRDALEREAVESDATLTSSGTVEATVLQAVDAFRLYAVAERKAIAASSEDLARRIAEQQARAVDARRRLELFDKLRQKQWSVWRAAATRESRRDLPREMEGVTSL